jgi:hypothetical protein
MRQRILAPAIAAVIAVVLAAPVHGQTAPQKTTTAATKGSPIPRTADGHPDLSGVYSNATTVPLARPADLGAKEFYASAEEKAQLDAARAAAARGGRGGGRGGRGGGAANIDPETGQPALAVHYDTTQFGLSGSTVIRSGSSLRTSIITGPDGKVPPLTPEAQKRQADVRAYNAQHQWDGPESRPIAERCIMWPNEGPPMMPAGYNADLQIAQGPGYVAFEQEMIHDTRIVPTDGRAHLPANIKQWFGDARGHWEGDKLVVETTNFTNKTAVQGAPTTEALKVTEKFSRLDANTVLYEFTVDDPGTWTKPWSGEIAMTKIDSPIYEYACHEGNHGMANNLSGARATEKK